MDSSVSNAPAAALRLIPRVRDPRQNPHVSELALFDIAGTPGVAADISHVNTKAQVKVSSPTRPLATP